MAFAVPPLVHFSRHALAIRRAHRTQRLNAACIASTFVLTIVGIGLPVDHAAKVGDAACLPIRIRHWRLWIMLYGCSA